MVQAVRLMERHGLTIDEVDALTGPLLGRPNSATFRTADLTGLDVLKLVTEELAQATGEDFALPEWVLRLVEEGRLGEKTGAGFYKRVNGEIHTLDYRTLEYVPRAKLDLPELRALRDLPLRERLAKVLDLPGKYGAFLRELFAKTAHYTLEKAPGIATTWFPWTRPWSGASAGRRGPLRTWTPWGFPGWRPFLPSTA